MPNEDASLSAAMSAEWVALRKEIETRDAWSFQLMTGSITIATGLLTLFFALGKSTVTTGAIEAEVIRLPVVLYFIPFAVMLSALYLVIGNAHAVSRIAGYIQVFLEPRSGLRWEGMLSRFYGEVDASAWLKPFGEANVMFWVFVALSSMNAVIFYLVGDWDWLPHGALGIVVLVVYLLLPFLAFYDAKCRLGGEECARDHYVDLWKRVLDPSISRTGESPGKEGR